MPGGASGVVSKSIFPKSYAQAERFEFTREFQSRFEVNSPCSGGTCCHLICLFANAVIKLFEMLLSKINAVGAHPLLVNLT